MILVGWLCLFVCVVRAREPHTLTNNKQLPCMTLEKIFSWLERRSLQPKERSSPSLCQGKINLHVQVENSFCVGGWLRPSNHKKMFSRTCNTGRGSVGKGEAELRSFSDQHILPSPVFMVNCLVMGWWWVVEAELRSFHHHQPYY